MNIKRTIATTILAASMALTAAIAPMDALAGSQSGNTSETNSGHTSQRSTRSTGKQALRGDMDALYVNYGTGDILAFMRMDMESEGMAEMMVDMFGDPDFVNSQIDINIDGTFKVRGLGNCAGMYGDNDGIDIYFVVCQDETYINVIFGSDKDEVLDVMEGVQLDGELVLPRGYEEYEG